MNKKPDIADRTRQTFIEAFCLLYCKKPLEKITVQEIARRAGYNRSTFYQYFMDIDELLEEVENYLLDYIYEKRNNVEIGNNSFIRDLVDMYETKAIYINALLGDFGSSHFIEHMKSSSNLDIPELNLSDDNKLKPYLIEYHLSTTLSLFKLWLHRDKDLTSTEFLSLIGNLYNNGISSIV